MKSINIKSHFGNYSVFFRGKIEYNEIIDDGDIVVIDRIVFAKHKEQFKKILDSGNMIIIDATEEQKSYEGLIPLIDEIINRGFHKNNKLIAIGGGITQDSVAFISSILYRGVDWVFIPTTLLSQCDSCIGSKTSVNFAGYKNQVGGFYPPKDIYISSVFLRTLHKQELKSGLGEMLHYYVVGGEPDFELYENNFHKVDNDEDTLMQLVRKSLEIKKKYIEIDEYDRRERQIFNYGHSFGHAIESMTDYAVPHGIAVSYGMDIANYVAVRKGLLDDKVRQRIRKVVETFWTNGEISRFNIDDYLGYLKKDKKNKGGLLGIILCSGFGNLSKHMIKANDEFRDMLEDYFKSNEYIDY